MKRQFINRILASLLFTFCVSIVSSCYAPGWWDRHATVWLPGAAGTTAHNKTIAANIQFIYLTDHGETVDALVTLSDGHGHDSTIPVTSVNGLYTSPTIAWPYNTLSIAIHDNTTGVDFPSYQITADDWGSHFMPDLSIAWNPTASCIVIMDQSVGVGPKDKQK